MNKFSIKYAKHILFLAIFIAFSSSFVKVPLKMYQEKIAQLNQAQLNTQPQINEEAQLQAQIIEMINQQNNQNSQKNNNQNYSSYNSPPPQYQPAPEVSQTQNEPQKDEATLLKERINSAQNEEKIALKRELSNLYKNENKTQEAISQLEEIFLETKEKQDFLSLANFLLENKNISKLKTYYQIYKNVHNEPDFEVDSFDNLF